MKKFALLAAVLAMFVFSSCGGDSTPTPTPTPTSDSTKAGSEAVVTATNEAAFATAENALAGAAGIAMIVKSVEKETISHNFTYTYDCSETGVSGSVETAGNVSGTCTESAGTWTCSNLTIDITTMQFNDCTVTVTVDSTDYTVALNGTGSALLGGSVSGTDQGMTSLNFSGTGEANTTMSGDLTGTAVMDLDLTGSGAPNPTVTCDGTVDVTINSTTEVCTVNTDCSGCVL